MLSRLEMSYAFRRCDFDRVPSHARLLASLWSTIKRHEAQGKEPWEEAALSVEEREPAEHDDDFVINYLLAALMALVCADRLTRTHFQEWRDDAAKLADHERMTSFVLSAEHALSMGIADAIGVMKDSDRREEERLLGALQVTSCQDEVQPNDLFYAHAWILHRVMGYPWEADVADAVAACLTDQWLRLSEFQAVLRAPRVTVPAIRRACGEKTGSAIARAAGILLAASGAVDVRLPGKVIEKLQAASAQL